MKTKLIQFIPLVSVLVVAGFRYFSNWCVFTTRICYGTFIDHISLSLTKPFYVFSLYFIPIAVILASAPRNLFNSWFKFAIWAIPLSIIYIASTPVIDTSFLPFHREDAARLAGEVFAGISFVLIIWKSLGARRNQN